MPETTKWNLFGRTRSHPSIDSSNLVCSMLTPFRHPLTPVVWSGALGWRKSLPLVQLGSPHFSRAAPKRLPRSCCRCRTAATRIDSMQHLSELRLCCREMRRREVRPVGTAHSLLLLMTMTTSIGSIYAAASFQESVYASGPVVKRCTADREMRARRGKSSTGFFFSPAVLLESRELYIESVW